ncbi:MAG: 1-acyl-sn-glycerol-3-phosphate acyltransferase [Actinomycetota bacterium]|nr:1-acyl-sn-glycerol-3-phosphate acyltransferase [Actinomycetota bacterium]
MPVLPRLIRRLVIIPIVFVLELVLVVISPAILLVAAVVDVVLRGPWRTVRLVAVGLVVVLSEIATVASLFFLWVANPSRSALRSERMQDAHYLLFRWWLATMYRAGERLLGLRVEFEESPPAEPGPVIVLARHAGPGDSLLLVHFLLSEYERRPRLVMKDDLQWDSGIDLIGGRLPNAFIGTSDDAEREIANLSRDLGERDAVVLFPEGVNFSKRRRDRAIARLRRKGLHEEADLAERMRHVLPPYTGGAIAAMSAARDADVIFVAHTGLEDLSALPTLWRNVPLERPLRVRYWRVQCTDIPAGAEAQNDWLYDWWGRVDRWIEEQRPPERAQAPASP